MNVKDVEREEGIKKGANNNSYLYDEISIPKQRITMIKREKVMNFADA